MSEQNTPESELNQSESTETEAQVSEAAAEPQSQSDSAEAEQIEDSPEAEVAADAEEDSGASAEAGTEPVTEPEADADVDPETEPATMTDDEVAAAVEAALTGSIPVAKPKKDKAESKSSPVVAAETAVEPDTASAESSTTASSSEAQTPASETEPAQAKPVGYGLSGNLGDFQGSTQFVYGNPSNAYVYPAISDAPARKNPFANAKVGVLAPVVLTIGALVGGAIGGSIVSSALNATNHSSSSITINNPDSVTWATAAAAKAAQSVVTISVVGATGSGIGSGVILTNDGYILTNTHVVTLDGESSTPTIQVKFADGKIVDGQLVGTDPTNDLAVIKVKASGLQPATFADSSQINVGDSVLAIGAPLGLDATVTKGIVSTLNRTIDEASSAPNAAATGATIHMSVIQTDAAINPGNSGGALVDSNGDVIGINVAIATAGSSSLGGQAGNIGVGFAIPSNIAQRIAKDIMSSGKATHGLLGAQIYNNSKSNVADAFSAGAKIDSLTAGGPGEKAGLKKGDVVIKLNDSKVTSASDLTALVRQQPAGASVTLTVVRGGSTITVKVVLGNADSAK